MVAFRQTREHVRGKYSYHQIACFTGQPISSFDGNLEALLRFMGETAKLDAVELASWQLGLRRADTDEGAKAYAAELIALCKKYGLDIVSLAAHLQGQCLGDRASLKTIGFQGGEVMKAYEAWLATSTPPEDDPYRVPDHVAEMSRKLATLDLLATGRLARFIGEQTGRNIPVSGFIGSAGAWDDIFPFPPLPAACGTKLTIGNRADFAAKVILKRFAPVWDEYKKWGVRFGVESHPGELAAGDITSTARFLGATDAAGYNGVVGLNFDASHMVWQKVDPIAFIERFIEYIWSVHHKGVQLRTSRPAQAGVFGGWEDFGSLNRYWDFVYASSDRDATAPEDILITLNRLGFDGAITIECEDTGFDLRDCLIAAARRLREIDLTPSGGKFDEAFTKA